MFLRPHSRNKDGKGHTYWSLVETVRTPDGPRQKTLCYLGELNSSAQARWLRTVEVFNEQGEAQQLKLFPSGVEPPAGDTLRAWQTKGVATDWKIYARNKKSLCLDFRKPEAIEILLKLLPSAAIFVESFRPGTLEAMELPPATLQVSDPTLAPDWENTEVAAPTSSVAVPTAARTDRSIDILLCVTETLVNGVNAAGHPRLHATRFKDCIQGARFWPVPHRFWGPILWATLPLLVRSP